MREMLFAANAEGLDLKYFVTAEEWDEVHLYGISVEKYINGALAEENSSGPISDEKDYVNGLAAMLADGMVTPMVLNEILDEIC